MSNKDSVSIAKLRFQQYDDGRIHIHDDNASIKFQMDSSKFKPQIKEKMSLLKGNDGVAKIEGEYGINLFLIKEGSNFNAVILRSESLEGEINSFVRTLK